jgi:hypothetical protein
MSWQWPTTAAGTLISRVLPTIVAMGHLPSKNAQVARKKKRRKGTVVPA